MCFCDTGGGLPSRLLFLVIVCSCMIVTEQSEDEYRLTQYLMTTYNLAVRPAQVASQPLNVSFGVSLHHIIDVDERNQVLTTNCWLTQIWNDHHLRWNSSDFSGVNIIRLPFSSVWKPDIILYNNADSQYSTAVINTNVIVTSDGQVTWLSHGIYRSSCDMDVEYFPFDIQRCKMKWASWTYDGYALDMLTMGDSGDLSNYQSNGEFDLMSFVAKKNIEIYSCCPEPYPDITFVIELRRRPMFYVFNLILPCMLINGIALLVFYVPSESGEKVTLGISAVLSMTVFLMTIRESLPPTEKTPLISLYYGVSISLVSFASGLSVLTLNIFHRGARGCQVPRLVRSIVLHFLARAVLVHFDNNSSNNNNNNNNNNSDGRMSSGGEHYLQSLEVNGYNVPQLSGSPSLGDMRPHRRHVTSQMMSPVDTATVRMSPLIVSDEFEQRLMTTLERVQRTIDRSEHRASEQQLRELALHEWQQVAIVCDRFLLMIFLLATAAATSAILLSSPHVP